MSLRGSTGRKSVRAQGDEQRAHGGPDCRLFAADTPDRRRSPVVVCAKVGQREDSETEFL